MVFSYESDEVWLTSGETGIQGVRLGKCTILEISKIISGIKTRNETKLKKLLDASISLKGTRESREIKQRKYKSKFKESEHRQQTINSGNIRRSTCS